MIAELLPTWIQNNDKTKLPVIAESVALFTFTKYQDPVLGGKLEKGFNWMMAADDLNSTKKAASLYKQVANYLKDNPGAVMVLKQTIQQAISLKNQANIANPSKNLEEQVTVLNGALESIK